MISDLTVGSRARRSSSSEAQFSGFRRVEHIRGVLVTGPRARRTIIDHVRAQRVEADVAPSFSAGETIAQESSEELVSSRPADANT